MQIGLDLVLLPLPIGDFYLLVPMKKIITQVIELLYEGVYIWKVHVIWVSEVSAAYLAFIQIRCHPCEWDWLGKSWHFRLAIWLNIVRDSVYYNICEFWRVRNWFLLQIFVWGCQMISNIDFTVFILALGKGCFCLPFQESNQNYANCLDRKSVV